jgi:hypothetical protein
MARVASGAGIDYWDAVTHLYTAQEMEDIRMRKAMSEATAKQMQAVKDMTDMARHRQEGSRD